jgi:hypothetical protein
VFTARYALSPYIKQIRSVFKGLIFKNSYDPISKHLTAISDRSYSLWRTNCIYIHTVYKRKWVPEIFPGGLRRPVRRAHNLTTFKCRLSINLGASNSWNPKGLSRPVMGLLYLYCLRKNFTLPQGSQCTHNVALRCVRITIVAGEKR